MHPRYNFGVMLILMSLPSITLSPHHTINKIITLKYLHAHIQMNKIGLFLDLRKIQACIISLICPKWWNRRDQWTLCHTLITICKQMSNLGLHARILVTLEPYYLYFDGEFNGSQKYACKNINFACREDVLCCFQKKRLDKWICFCGSKYHN